MILLPIGHEESTVRRLPVVTFGIMAICVILFLVSGQGMLVSDADTEIFDNAEEAFEYYWEHPYLELDDEFEVLVYGEPDSIEQEYGELAEAFDSTLEKPGTSVDLAAEQAEMDRLTTAVIESRDRHSFFRWGLIPADFSFIGLLTHMFMHGGWLHLIGNLLILYLLGPFIEDVWGRPLFAALYILSGIIAAFAHIAFNSGSEAPMIGASGAIAGVMGAFLIHYHRTKIKFFYMLMFFVRGTFDAPAWIMLPLWFGEQLMLAVMVGGELSGVAYWAHVGGFACGLGGSLFVRRAGILERYVQPKLDQQTETAVVERPGLDQALVARSEERHEDAYELLEAELKQTPSDIDTAELYWETAVLLERQSGAVPTMLRAVQAQVRHGETDSVCSMWERLVAVDPSIQADTLFLLRLTRLQTQQSDHEQARQTLRRASLSAGMTPAPGLALKIARAGERLEPAISKAMLRALLQRDDVSAEERSEAQTLLAQIDAPAINVE